MSKRLSAAIAIVITTAWTVSFIVGTINPNYHPEPSVQALMMLVAGAAFTNAVRGKG